MPITKSELARHWGLSRQRVGQLVDEGCPLNSIRAADLWKENRGKKRAPTNKAPTASEPPPGGSKEPRPPKYTPSKTGDSLRDALENAIKVADGAFEDYELSRANNWSSRSIRLSEHNKALDSRLRTEKAYREELERRRLLIPLSEAVDMCRRCMEPVLRRLKKLPGEQGPQCNPQNAIQAVSILENEVNSIIATGRKAIDGL